MAANMNVSVALRLRDEFTGPLRSLLQNLQGLTRSAQEFNRALGGTGTNTTFGKLQSQARALSGEVRNLAQGLSPKEAAKALGLSQSYVYELLASEALPSITIGRTRRIPRRALEAFVEARSAEQCGYIPHPIATHRSDGE